MRWRGKNAPLAPGGRGVGGEGVACASASPSPQPLYPRGRGAWARRAGVAAVEMAVVLAFILIPLAYGMIEVSRAVQVKESLTDAARAGCRLAVQPGYTNDLVTAQINQALTANGFTATDAKITIRLNGTGKDVSNAQSGDQISVKVSLHNAKTNWLLPWFLSGGMIESETLVMMFQG